MIWLMTLAPLAAAYGWARWAAHQTTIPARFTLAAGLVVPLGIGGLSLAMLWLGLFNVPLAPARTLALYMLLMLPGWVLAARSGGLALHWPHLPAAAWFPMLLLAMICGAVLANAALWPFYRADALGIYVPIADRLATSRALLYPSAQYAYYEMYPQAISLNIAHIFQLAGWGNPYPARVITALLSLSVFPATYALARAVFPAQPRAALLAVGLVALTPDVSRWASAVYVDLPMAAYYTFGIAFASAGARNQSLADLMLAAACFGLAAWTKNAALLGISFFFIYLLMNLIIGQLRLNQLVIVSIIVALVAAPWYLRNLWLTGTLTPDTVWTDDAQQNLHNLFVLISHPQNFGVPGWVMLGGVAWAVCRPAARPLLWWSLPFFALWFLYASYDPRFILLFLPVLAVMGGGVLADLWQGLQPAHPVRLPIRLAGLVLLVLFAVGIMWDSIEYKRALLHSPLTHQQKLEIVR